MASRLLAFLRNLVMRPSDDDGTPAPAPRPKPAPPPRTHGIAQPIPDYPGDFTGRPHIEYAPAPAERPDPGEVVWAWVPFEEDHAQGKERPVLVIGRDAPWLLALPLTSQDHDRDAAQEARAGRHWHDIGTGVWDRTGRPSEARVDRIVRINETRVRREGVRLDRRIFESVAEHVRRFRP